jgi:hypothetical protein
MGTSYVEFRQNGFWTRDSLLADWLTTLIDEMRSASNENDWSLPLIKHWERQREIDGGCMALDLDGFLSDDEKRGFVIAAAEPALMRTSDASKRTGQLFVALLRGRVKTDASSPIDYL